MEYLPRNGADLLCQGRGGRPRARGAARRCPGGTTVRPRPTRELPRVVVKGEASDPSLGQVDGNLRGAGHIFCFVIFFFLRASPTHTKGGRKCVGSIAKIVI